MPEPAASPSPSAAANPASLFARVRPLVLFGLAVAAARLALDFARTDASMWIGVYFAMPVALLVAGVRGTYDDLKWWRLVRGMMLVAVCCWFVPNTVSYTAGQFLGWTHGRFAATRTAPIAESTLMKLASGLMVGGMTTIAGTIWLTVTATLFVWLPGLVRARRTGR